MTAVRVAASKQVLGVLASCWFVDMSVAVVGTVGFGTQLY